MPQSRNASKSLFLTLCVVGLFAILSSTMSKNPVLKPFATTLGAPDNLVGFVAAASTIPGMLISLPAASLSDFLGRRKILLFSAFIFASAPFVYLFVSSWWQLIPVRFYHGFATAIFVPVAEATIAERFPLKRGERISIFSSVTAVGRAIAPFLGGYLLFLTSYGYSTLYLAVGVAGVTSFIVALFFLKEKKSLGEEKASPKATFKGIFQSWVTVAKNKDAQMVAFIQASQFYVFGTVEFFLVGYLSEVVKLDPFAIGIIMGSQIVAIIVARPAMGKVSDKFGRRLPIIFGSVLNCFTLVAFPFSGQFPTLLFLSITFGLGFAAVASSTSPLISEVVPSSLMGTSLGFLSMTMDIGQTLGPIISGVILAATMQYAALFYSLSFLLIASIIALILTKTAKK